MKIQTKRNNTFKEQPQLNGVTFCTLLDQWMIEWFTYYVTNCCFSIYFRYDLNMCFPACHVIGTSRKSGILWNALESSFSLV